MTENNVLQPWQERVIAEKKDLDEKRSKLIEFISGADFLHLEKLDRDLYLIQESVMEHYSKILGHRISRF